MRKSAEGREEDEETRGGIGGGIRRRNKEEEVERGVRNEIIEAQQRRPTANGEKD